jgi:hypothetical protein
MRGVGTIYGWYRSGRIDGDDEVALLHGEAEFGYRAASEALVNIRHTLERALAAGSISETERDALAGAMGAVDHGSRSYPALFACDAFTRLPASAQAKVRALASDRDGALKQRDARAALEWVAANLDTLAAGAAALRTPARRVERPEEVLLRGVPAADHELVPLRDLLAEAAADVPRTAAIVRESARRCFLLDWMQKTGVRAPQTAAADVSTEWLIANAITEAELRRELADRAAVEWLLSHEPAHFGLSRPFLEAWADAAGVDPPSDPAASFSERLLDFGPAFFGFDQWTADVAMARELQVTGEIARRAQQEMARAAGAI